MRDGPTSAVFRSAKAENPQHTERMRKGASVKKRLVRQPLSFPPARKISIRFLSSSPKATPHIQGCKPEKHPQCRNRQRKTACQTDYNPHTLSRCLSGRPETPQCGIRVRAQERRTSLNSSQWIIASRQKLPQALYRIRQFGFRSAGRIRRAAGGSDTPCYPCDKASYIPLLKNRTACPSRPVQAHVHRQGLTATP